MHSNIILEALKIRAFEETLLKEYSKGGIRGTIHTSLGQELLPLLISEILSPNDVVFGTHRSHGMYLALTGDFEGLMAEILGVEGATSKGLGGSQHLHSAQFYSNGIQGGLVPIAVGAADYVSQQKGVAVAFVGDGTFGQGILYEGLNLASVYSVPFILVIEDNKIAQSTPTKNVIAGSFEGKAKAFDIDYFECRLTLENKWQSEIVKCFEIVRSIGRPAILLVEQNRLAAHSKGDDNRNPQEIQDMQLRDYLNRSTREHAHFRQYYFEQLEYFSKMAQLLRSHQKCSASFADFTLREIPYETRPAQFVDDSNIRQMTYSALKTCLERDMSCKIIGEDIEYIPTGTSVPYGGAFGVTKDLSQLFPGRVINTPISESSIVGFAIGRALVGASTIVEVMFGDFCTLIVDQVRQQASKLSSMYGKLIEIPVLVRTPMGGRRGYGPTHSQNYEMLFFGIPNVVVYVQSIFFSSMDYVYLLETRYFCIAIENKDLYNSSAKQNLMLFNSILMNNSNYTILKSRATPSALIITYGFALNLVLDAVHRIGNANETFFDILVLKVVSPLNLTDHKDLLLASKQIVLVEECDSRTGLNGSLNKNLIDMGIRTSIFTIGGDGDIGASEHSENIGVLSTDKIINGLLSIL